MSQGTEESIFTWCAGNTTRVLKACKRICKALLIFLYNADVEVFTNEHSKRPVEKLTFSYIERCK
jgi:hypothetical protein